MDPGRIEVNTLPTGRFVVTKKTTGTEVSNTAEVTTHLQSVKPLEWQDTAYRVVTPKVISWDESGGLLTLELKQGENLEASLSSVENGRADNVNFTRRLLEWMKATGTFWRGVAPRHIVTDSANNEISLLDFERPLVLRKEGFNADEFNELLGGLVHEEFSAFLFENEQKSVFPDVYKTESPDKLINLSSIHGRRVKLLLTHFFGPLGETVTTEHLFYVYRFMSSIVTPFFVDGKPFFPLKEIDERTRDPQNYVSTVLQLSRIDRPQWSNYLKI
jgi:tRNA A-37 threonylcarbamoyl transferase component Bud32